MLLYCQKGGKRQIWGTIAAPQELSALIFLSNSHPSNFYCYYINNEVIALSSVAMQRDSPREQGRTAKKGVEVGAIRIHRSLSESSIEVNQLSWVL